MVDMIHKKITKNVFMFSGLLLWIYIIFGIILNEIVIFENDIFDKGIFIDFLSVDIIISLLLLILIIIAVLLYLLRYVNIINHTKLTEHEIEYLKDYLMPLLSIDKDSLTNHGINKAERLYIILEKLQTDSRM